MLMMNEGLGVPQTILAAVFLLHGILLLVLPTPVRLQMSSLIGGPRFARFISFAEVAAALGLTLPRWIGLMPWLVPVAAIGLVPIMAGATYLHVRHAARPQAVFDAVLLAFVLVVAYISL